MSQFSFRFPKSSKINPPPITLKGVGRLRINYKVLGFQLVTSWIVFIKKVSNECGTKPVSHLFKRWNINIIKILTRALSILFRGTVRVISSDPTFTIYVHKDSLSTFDHRREKSASVNLYVQTGEWTLEFSLN